MDFWHINQYAQSGDWHTRIGKFNFVGGRCAYTYATAHHGNADRHPSGCSWAAGPDMPSADVALGWRLLPWQREVLRRGWPYARMLQAAISLIRSSSIQPRNSLDHKSATYPDNQVNNMACGVLTDVGTH